MASNERFRLSNRLIKRLRIALGAVVVAALSTPSATAGPVQVDVSACREMLDVLKAMRNGASQAGVSARLDRLLQSKPYRAMFRHYNRSWRPNHLPPDVFKRMILSLQYPGVYTPGENERADTMRGRWTKFYPDLAPYEKQLAQLEAADLERLIDDGVRYAQGWLPPAWTIPDFYFPVIPNGGSPAFTIDDTQGYDFLQLSQDEPGRIDLNWLVGTVAHESHHLGMRVTEPAGLTPAQRMAFRVVSLSLAEGAATAFVSGPPPGCAPAVPEVPYHVFTADLAAAWKERVGEEAAILDHQVSLLARALEGRLTEEAFASELRDYWLSGSVGRAYVLGADMFAAIYLAFGKARVLSVMEDPTTLFESYNAALAARPEILGRCPRVPDVAVAQALALGAAPPARRPR